MRRSTNPACSGPTGPLKRCTPPFSTRRRVVRFDMRGVDRLCVCRSPVSGKLPERALPDATPRPADETVIDRRRWTVEFRAIAPAAAALEDMHDAANDAAVVYSLDPANIRRQVSLDPRPLFVAQPEQIPAHQSFPQYESVSYCLTGKINEF